jgi:hypothetical protein
MKDLSPEHIQRINAKIEELRGCKPCKKWVAFNSFSKMKNCDCEDCYPFRMPTNYWQSLDACAEMVESLDYEKSRRFAELLWSKSITDSGDQYDDYFQLIKSTAPQRVTAFLAVHNLTIEEI